MRKTINNRITPIVFFLICILLFTGCGGKTAEETVRIGSLKGPTTMGLLFLQEESRAGRTQNNYTFQMETAADTLLPLMASGKLDLALVPANVAAVLYQKTQGGVCVIEINTLGVLYLVSANETIGEPENLAGKTVYLTGKGTTPDYVLRYLLQEKGILEEVTLEYKSEATEVVSALENDVEAAGFLPQPFVTAACLNNEKLQIVWSANDAWKNAGEAGETGLVTGVTVVRREFLEQNPEAVRTFLEEHAASVHAINHDPEKGGVLCEEAGIVAKAMIARKAMPYCNITCITGAEMKTALEKYYHILYGFDPKALGGALPGEDFYEKVD